MAPSRRSLLAAGATGTLALTAGCLDFVLGDGPLEFASDRVAPTDEALASTGYREREVERRTIEETVEVVGVERDVHASFWSSVYAKRREHEGQEHDASLFAAVSIPGMTVLGRSVNPLEEMSNEELLEEFLDRAGGEHGGVDDLQHEETFSLEILGDSRDVDLFVGETEFAGERMEVDLTLTSFDHEGDFLVLLGSHPELLAEESANVEVLMESVEHPV